MGRQDTGAAGHREHSTGAVLHGMGPTGSPSAVVAEQRGSDSSVVAEQREHCAEVVLHGGGTERRWYCTGAVLHGGGTARDGAHWVALSGGCRAKR
jgi:hypothetical protein